MKRLILFSFAFLTTMLSWADVAKTADYRVVCKDGSVAFFSGAVTEMSFSEDGSVLYISNIEGSQTKSLISYAVEGIEAIEFAEGGTHNGKYSYGGSHVDVAIDPADDTSYTEVAEKVITDAKHDDYGDFEENLSVAGKVTVTYNGTVATVSASGKTVTSGDKPSNVLSGVMVQVQGAHVAISSMVKDVQYTLKGTTPNGSFKLSASSMRSRITLDGVNITNPTGAAINIQSSKTIMVKLADGTTNTLKDGVTYTMTTGEDQKGTFFSEGQLVFSGKGSLDVQSIGGHGIVSDDYVRVRSGNITVNSVRDGINTNDRFIMYGGVVNVTAQQDGLDIGKGYIEIGGGKLTVNAVDEGITASYEGDDAGNIDPLITPYINIKGGLIKVTTTDDKGHAVRAMSALSMTGGIVQATAKGAGAKAVMSEGDMTFTGGKLTALTEGNSLYEADVKELSSAAAVRSKGVLTIANAIVGAKSIGAGGKGINNVGNIVLRNAQVTVVAQGEGYEHNGLDARSRGVDTDGSIAIDGGRLLVRSYATPLNAASGVNFKNKAVYNGYQVGE